VSYIIGFNDEGGTEVAAVGGKGANLGLLTIAGFRVPPGFTVATNAYLEFIEANGLADRILIPNARYQRDIGDRLMGGDYARVEKLRLFDPA